MNAHEPATTRTVRFHEYGEPADVLRLDQAAVPEPGPGRIQVAVHACGLNPADWALCRGLFQGQLPRGIGLELSGTVEAAGDGVTDVKPGDLVLGTADYAGAPVAGASDHAIMDHWTPVPDGLDPVQAAALPMAVETACRSLDCLGVTAGQTVLIHGAGTTIGFAAVQMALQRGARVIATAGDTYAARLRKLGATVTAYGQGMTERVTAAAQAPLDLILDTAPPSGILPTLIHLANDDPTRVLTVSDLAAAAELGARNSIGADATLRHDALPDYASLAAKGQFTIPIAQTFPLEAWPTALKISQSGHAHGKLILLPRSA